MSNTKLFKVSCEIRRADKPREYVDTIVRLHTNKDNYYPDYLNSIKDPISRQIAINNFSINDLIILKLKENFNIDYIAQYDPEYGSTEIHPKLPCLYNIKIIPTIE